MADETRKDIILSVKTDTSEATSGINDLKDDLQNLNNTPLDVPFKNLKSQIKEATIEAQKMAEKYGVASQQFKVAATNVESLKGKFDEVNISIKSFNPDNRLQSLVTVSQGAIGTIAGVSGAMQFLGVQSGTAEESIAKLQGLMAFSNALNSVGDIKDSFVAFGAVIQSTTTFQKLNAAATTVTTVAIKALGGAAITSSNGFKILKGAIVATGIGALVIGITALIQNFDVVKEKILNLIPGLGKLTSFIGGLIEKFTDFVGITSEAERTLEKFINTNERTNETIDNQIKILEATGGREEVVYRLKKQRVENELNNLRESLKVKKKLSEEELKQFRDLKTQQTVLDIQEANRLKKKNEPKKVTTKGAAGVDPRVQAEQQITEFLSTEREKRLDLQRTELEKELNQIAKNYEDKIALARKYNLDVQSLEQERVQQSLIAINKDAEQAREANNVKNQIDDEFFKQLLPKVASNQSTLTATESEQVQQRIRWADLEFEQKEQIYNSIGNLAGVFADLVGRQTVAGKALAIAQATINTYLAASKSLSADYSVFGPFALAAKIAATASTIGVGLATVKNIVQTKVPGSSFSSFGGSVNTPVLGTAPVINSTALTPQTIQDVRVTNQNNAPIRAYITNSDLQNNEQRNRFLNTISTF